MKSKHGAQTTRQKIIAWLPLLLVLSATAVWKGMRFYTNQLLLPGESPIFYPIHEIINIHWQEIAFVLAGLMFVLMSVLAIRKYREEKWGVLRPSTALLFFLLLGCTPTEPHLLYRQSFATNQHTYHLVESRQNSHFASIVLECDTKGVMCHYYATPYKSREACSIHVDRGYLRQDKTTKHLVLQGEWESFGVKAGEEYFNDPTWCEVFRA